MENMTLEQIAEDLKSKRLNKDLTLEQVAEHTKISKKNITAIEEGEFKQFSAPVYLYGFVVNLCELYGLDSTDILASLKEGLEKETLEQKEEEHEVHLEDKKQPVLKQKNYLLTFLLAGVALLLGLVFLAVITLLDKNEQKQVTSINTDNIVTKTTIYKMNSQKETFDLKVEDEVNILFDSGYQKLAIKSIEDKKMSFYLNDGEFSLTEEESLTVDVNKDQTDDIEIRLKKISGELAIIHINQLNYQIKSIDYQRIWDNEEHVLVNTDYVLFKNQEKTPIEVYVKATTLPSHLSYNIDGKRQNTSMLNAGKDIVILAEEHIEVIIGNYRSVILIVNKIPINLTLDNDKYSVTKIIKWIPDANNETRFDLIIKDYVN